MFRLLQMEKSSFSRTNQISDISSLEVDSESSLTPNESWQFVMQTEGEILDAFPERSSTMSKVPMMKNK